MIHIYIQLKEEKNTAKDFAAMIEIRAKLSEAAFVSRHYAAGHSKEEPILTDDLRTHVIFA